jgi:predicted enzyme related to lactoylglutathione lyase
MYPFAQIRVVKSLMSTIVHFDVPAENIDRAKKFYSELLGWKFEAWPGMEYNLITTTNLEGVLGVGGGMGKRMDPSQRMVNYFGVKSIDVAIQQVKNLGGKMLTDKMAVPAMGYLANCVDTEGNTFGLWEEDSAAR